MAKTTFTVGDKVRLSAEFLRRLDRQCYTDKGTVREVRKLSSSATYVGIDWDYPEYHEANGALAANLELVPEKAAPA